MFFSHFSSLTVCSKLSRTVVASRLFALHADLNATSRLIPLHCNSDHSNPVPGALCGFPLQSLKKPGIRILQGPSWSDPRLPLGHHLFFYFPIASCWPLHIPASDPWLLLSVLPRLLSCCSFNTPEWPQDLCTCASSLKCCFPRYLGDWLLLPLGLFWNFFFFFVSEAFSDLSCWTFHVSRHFTLPLLLSIYYRFYFFNLNCVHLH